MIFTWKFVLVNYSFAEKVTSFTECLSELNLYKHVCALGHKRTFRAMLRVHDSLSFPFHTLHFVLQWQTERLEWHQFQCDLQVAVSVADRLREESEQALGSLQESHRAVKEQLAQALLREQEKDGKLERLRTEHEDVCRKLTELTLQQQQQERAELESLKTAHQVKDMTGCDQQRRQDSEEGAETKLVTEDQLQETEAEAKNTEEGKLENETSKEVDAKVFDADLEEANGSDGTQLTGKGVAEGYIRSLAALEKKKERQRDPRRIVMLSERSW